MGPACGCDGVVVSDFLPFDPPGCLLVLWYVIECVFAMRSTSYSEFRRNLAAALDSVIDDNAPWVDYLHWQATDRALLERVNVLVKACSRTPFAGIGKPEPPRGWER